MNYEIQNIVAGYLEYLPSKWGFITPVLINEHGQRCIQSLNTIERKIKLELLDPANPAFKTLTNQASNLLNVLENDLPVYGYKTNDSFYFGNGEEMALFLQNKERSSKLESQLISSFIDDWKGLEPANIELTKTEVWDLCLQAIEKTSKNYRAQFYRTMIPVDFNYGTLYLKTKEQSLQKIFIEKFYTTVKDALSIYNSGFDITFVNRTTTVSLKQKLKKAFYASLVVILPAILIGSLYFFWQSSSTNSNYFTARLLVSISAGICAAFVQGGLQIKSTNFNSGIYKALLATGLSLVVFIGIPFIKPPNNPKNIVYRIQLIPSVAYTPGYPQVIGDTLQLFIGENQLSQVIANNDHVIFAIPSSLETESKIRIKLLSSNWKLVSDSFSPTSGLVEATIEPIHNILRGIIIDTSRKPVQGATIFVDDITAVSDSNGTFVMQIPFSSTRGYTRMVISKKGYLRTEILEATSGNNIEVILKTKN